MFIKQSFFSKTNPKNLDPSYKMDLDFWGLNQLPYYFIYKREIFSFQNNPKNLDPSYKMDLDFWVCLGGLQLVLW